MDYKYIEQLLDKYWEGQTSLEEENILRTFFRQPDVPASLAKFKPLFAYQQQEVKDDVLGSDFDERIMSMIQQPVEVKARTVTMPQRLRPLFKAAAIIAIFLTLGNAAQSTFNSGDSETPAADTQQATKGASVAMGDSARTDTMQQSVITLQPAQSTIIK